MSPRLLAASVGIALACSAGCSSKSSSAPAQAGSSEPEAGSARPAPAAPSQQPAAPAPANPAAPLAPADSHGDYRERMKQFDTDGDGKLSEDERYAMMAARAGEVLGRNDHDGDGVLSKAEFEASPAARRVGDFAAADTDHNGSLSKDELGTAIVEAMKKAGGFRAWRGPRGSGAVPTPSPNDTGE
jgi:hypothetical protein